MTRKTTQRQRNYSASSSVGVSTNTSYNNQTQVVQLNKRLLAKVALVAIVPVSMIALVVSK